MDEMYQRHERGQIDWMEYTDHLRVQFHLEASNDEIKSGWNAIFKNEISETVNAIKRIKGNVSCFVFSNPNPTHQKFWVNKYPNVVSLFDQVFVSSEMGFRKPDLPAFNAISQVIGHDLSKIIFFDDTKENVEGAQKAGLQAVLVRDPVDVTNKLVELDLF